MSDDFTDLEIELKQLRPRALRPELTARLAAERPPTSRRPAVVVWLWPVLGAAAALAVFAASWRVFAPSETAQPPESTRAPAMAASPHQPRMVPAKATNLLYAASDDGIVRFADQTAARKVRLRYVDTITWRDPAGRASLQCTVPRDEVYFVPVVAY